jgi:hypothetical protein
VTKQSFKNATNVAPNTRIYKHLLLCLQAWIGELERDRSEPTLELISSHSLSSEKLREKKKRKMNSDFLLFFFFRFASFLRSKHSFSSFLSLSLLSDIFSFLFFFNFFLLRSPLIFTVMPLVFSVHSTYFIAFCVQNKQKNPYEFITNKRFMLLVQHCR